MKTHRPQLDGLRALAVTAVLVHHYAVWGARGSLAVWGVKLFFTLSGFLITGILLEARRDAEASGTPMGFVARQFYARRFLRIFPLYYAVVAAALALGVEPIREILPWIASYTLNFRMAAQGWYVDRFAHFWTLAVEEQFYLVWPWLVLFAPRKRLGACMAAMAAVGPLYRFYAVWSGQGLASYIATPACLDSLALGALLALAPARRRPPAFRPAALPAAIAAWAAVFFLQKAAPAVPFDILLDTIATWGFCIVIGMADAGIAGPGRILESPPLAYLGKISYGLYVFHPFVPEVMKAFWRRMEWNWPAKTPAEFVLLYAGAVLAASLSWRLFESPINGLKRHFQYRKDRPAPRLKPSLGHP